MLLVSQLFFALFFPGIALVRSAEAILILFNVTDRCYAGDTGWLLANYLCIIFQCGMLGHFHSPVFWKQMLDGLVNIMNAN